MEYPVDFVQVVRLQHGGADDADAVGGAHLDFHGAEEDVKVRFDGRAIALLVDNKGRAQWGAGHRSGCGVPALEGVGSAGEVGEFSVGRETGVRRAVFYELLAVELRVSMAGND